MYKNKYEIVIIEKKLRIRVSLGEQTFQRTSNKLSLYKCVKPNAAFN